MFRQWYWGGFLKNNNKLYQTMSLSHFFVALLLLQKVTSSICFTGKNLQHDAIRAYHSIDINFARRKEKTRLCATPNHLTNSDGNIRMKDEETYPPYVEFKDPKTGCTVVLIGCLHGSTSSANDVNCILNQKQTDSVVLELCAPRFRDIRKAMDSRSFSNKRGGLSGYVDMVFKTTNKLGFSSGIAAALLGGASSIQTALSGFEPGSEFIQAISYVESNKGCSIMLADQEVGETLKRFGVSESHLWSN